LKVFFKRTISKEEKSCHFIYDCVFVRVCQLEMARAASSPVFGQSARGFETVR